MKFVVIVIMLLVNKAIAQDIWFADSGTQSSEFILAGEVIGLSEAYMNETSNESIIFKKIDPLNPVIKAGGLLIDFRKFYQVDFGKRDFFVMINYSKDSIRIISHIGNLLGVKEVKSGIRNNWRPLQYHIIECRTGDKPLELWPGRMVLISMKKSAGRIAGTMRLRMVACTGTIKNIISEQFIGTYNKSDLYIRDNSKNASLENYNFEHLYLIDEAMFKRECGN